MRSFKEALGSKNERPTQELLVRNAFDQLVADIANATNERNKKQFAKTLAIAARSLKWSEQDLHALYAKRSDPSVRNFSALVRWSLKIKSTT